MSAQWHALALRATPSTPQVVSLILRFWPRSTFFRSAATLAFAMTSFLRCAVGFAKIVVSIVLAWVRAASRAFSACTKSFAMSMSFLPFLSRTMFCANPSSAKKLLK